MSDEEPEKKEPGRLDRINDTLGKVGNIVSAVDAIATAGVSLYKKGQELGFIGKKETTSSEFSKDDKVYKTVKIGDQVWMAENLNFECEGSMCYDNDPKNAKKYGRLYDWETAKKACPSGGHLPSEEEWGKLIEAVGGLYEKKSLLYLQQEVFMYAVNAVYDGSHFQTLEPVEIDGRYEVVITFVKKIDPKNDIDFCEQLSRNSLKDAWFPGDEDL